MHACSLDIYCSLSLIQISDFSHVYRNLTVLKIPFYPVLCSSLTPLMDGMISYSDPTLGRDTVATHICEAGYALTTDLTTRTCGVTSDGVGDWSESPLVCAGMGPPNTCSTNHSHYLTGSACPDLTDLQNGVISYSTVSDNSYRRVTTVATHTCDTGSALTTDLTTRTCSMDGVWSGSPLVCAGMGPPNTYSTNHSH